MPKPEEVPKKTKPFLPKAEEVPKKQKKHTHTHKVAEVLGLEVSRILVFLVPPQVLARFSRKILPEPEEVPKKNQSLEVKILPKPEEVPKKTKKTKFRRSWAWRAQEICFFWYILRFWQGFQENIART